MRIILITAIVIFLLMAVIFPISFSQKIETNLSSEELWQLLEDSLLNSDNVENWPHEINSIRSKKIAVNSTINVTYKWPYERTFQYKITSIERGKRLTYSPTGNHPYRGEIKIEIEGSDLLWHGEYSSSNPFAHIFFKFFEWKFFSALKKNLS